MTLLSTTKQWDPPQHAAQRHPPSVHHQQEQKQPTVLLRTTSCTGRTHSPAATPDFSVPLRIIGCPDGLTHLQPHRITTPLWIIGCTGRTHLPAASPDLCATPDNQLPRTDSLAGSFTGSICAYSPTDYPGTQMPVAGCRHIAPDHLATARIQHDTSNTTFQHTDRKHFPVHHLTSLLHVGG